MHAVGIRQWYGLGSADSNDVIAYATWHARTGFLNDG
jgi:hypothetical protein